MHNENNFLTAEISRLQQLLQSVEKLKPQTSKILGPDDLKSQGTALSRLQMQSRNQDINQDNSRALGNEVTSAYETNTPRSHFQLASPTTMKTHKNGLVSSSHLEFDAEPSN